MGIYVMQIIQNHHHVLQNVIQLAHLVYHFFVTFVTYLYFISCLYACVIFLLKYGQYVDTLLLAWIWITLQNCTCTWLWVSSCVQKILIGMDMDEWYLLGTNSWPSLPVAPNASLLPCDRVPHANLHSPKAMAVFSVQI